MLVVYVMMRFWKGKRLRRTQAEEGKDEQGVRGMSEPKNSEQYEEKTE